MKFFGGDDEDPIGIDGPLFGRGLEGPTVEYIPMNIENMSKEELETLQEKIETKLRDMERTKEIAELRTHKERIQNEHWFYYIEDAWNAGEYEDRIVPPDEQEPCVGFSHGDDEGGFIDDHWDDETREFMDRVLENGPFYLGEIVECTFPLKGTKEEAIAYLEDLGFKKGTPQW